MNVNYRNAMLAALAEIVGTDQPFSAASIVKPFGSLGVRGSGATQDQYSEAIRNLLTRGRKAFSADVVDATLSACVGAVISGERQLQRNGTTGIYTFADISD